MTNYNRDIILSITYKRDVLIHMFTKSSPGNIKVCLNWVHILQVQSISFNIYAISSLLICYCLIIIYKYHFYTKVHCSRFQSALYYRKKTKSLHNSYNEKHILQLHKIRFRSVFTENFFQSKVTKILQKLKFIRQYIFNVLVFWFSFFQCGNLRRKIT